MPTGATAALEPPRQHRWRVTVRVDLALRTENLFACRFALPRSVSHSMTRPGPASWKVTGRTDRPGNSSCRTLNVAARALADRYALDVVGNRSSSHSRRIQAISWARYQESSGLWAPRTAKPIPRRQKLPAGGNSQAGHPARLKTSSPAVPSQARRAHWVNL